MNITLNDLRDMFCKATKIVLVNDIIGKDGNYIDTERIEINNLLWGTPTFSGIPVELYRVQAIGKNVVEVTTNMPNRVFAAWKAYAEENSEYNYQGGLSYGNNELAEKIKLLREAINNIGSYGFSPEEAAYANGYEEGIERAIDILENND